ncbi:MAG: hypothetical protein ACJARP_003295 [Vicingaceae bacterium]|jgi:hypothetical protein
MKNLLTSSGVKSIKKLLTPNRDKKAIYHWKNVNSTNLIGTSKVDTWTTF